MKIKTNQNKIFIGVIIILLILIVGYFGYDYYQTSQDKVYNQAYKKGIEDMVVELNVQEVFPLINQETGEIQIVPLQEICRRAK